MQLIAGFAGACTVLFIGWVLQQFLAIWSSGVGSCIVEILVYLAFAATSAYWVIYLKVQNVALVIGDENVWGFAQMLSLCLILFVVFAPLNKPHVQVGR